MTSPHLRHQRLGTSYFPIGNGTRSACWTSQLGNVLVQRIVLSQYFEASALNTLKGAVGIRNQDFFNSFQFVFIKLKPPSTSFVFCSLTAPTQELVAPHGFHGEYLASKPNMGGIGECSKP